jgi:hypothetical protein
MSWDRIRQSVSGAIVATAMLLPLPMFSQATSAVGSAVSSSVLPLVAGARWTYAGKVEWTVPNSGKVKRVEIRWVTEVVEIVEGSGRRAAVVRDFPDELAWYEPQQSPGFCVLLGIDNRVYRLRADGEKQARALAQRLVGNPHELPDRAEQLLLLPLAVGHKWGQEPAREDSWYGWCVERKESKKLSIKGMEAKGPRTIYRLAYRTCPDHQLLDVAPGLGVVRYVYSHHGTVASADVHLVSFCPTRSPDVLGGQKGVL